MRYVVVVEGCGFKGSYEDYNSFDNLMEAWSFYKRSAHYTFAGNDYQHVRKPYLAEYDYKEDGHNDHHFFTPEWRRITKKHNLKNGYVFSNFGWINTKETVETVEVVNLFSDLEEEFPF